MTTENVAMGENVAVGEFSKRRRSRRREGRRGAGAGTGGTESLAVCRGFRGRWGTVWGRW